MNLERTLRQHDAAADVTDDLIASPRAAATLFRVTQEVPGTAGILPKRRHRIRYSMAVVIAAVGVVVAPVLGGGNAAFAEWTTKARAATPAEARQWGTYCQGMVGDALDGIRRVYSPQVVEMRGKLALAYLEAPDGYESLCVTETEPSGPGGSFTGQSLTGKLSAVPVADGLATNSVLDVQLQGGTLYAVAGKMGDDVVSVTFDAGGVDAEATVQNGYFVAWWPERKPASLLERATRNGPPNPDVKITLKDGTSRVRPIQDFDISPM
ncbi:hypothetical protein [Kineosporia sp. NBRC 101731]|uniref:hypothetical protein n=1 Tax=Kineosporia sp. NBRC 101731 TaxID=3032199 RepID=UPI00249FEA0B|nr:hypothetical protein [Kineosporia sp. NBRC 101731]GLY27413.1 hypothetical protein Kisp02_07780 [Kineosporia sp. NBRC 101731]